MLFCVLLLWGNGYSQSKGIWISRDEIMQLPTSGAAWEAILRTANSNFGKAKGGHDDPHDTYTLAQAYAAVRLDDNSLRAKVAENILSAIGSESGGNVLSLARNMIGYVISADLIDLKNFDAAKDSQFRAWLSTVRNKELGGQGTLISIHERRPNNFGTHATAARAAIAIYLGEQAELDRTAKIFKGWMGDRSSYSSYTYGDLSWQADPGNPVGINPKGSSKQGHSIDGVLPDDQRRGGSFRWPPPKENYVYGALQGALAASQILNRVGYDTWNWQDQAILRAYKWLHEQADFSPSGDDVWQLPLVDHVYGTNYWSGSPVGNGKNMGWTDWTHAKQGNPPPPQNETSIRGAILNLLSDAVLANATVQLKVGNETRQTTVTNFLGEFTFRALQAGSYQIVASKDGFESASTNVSVAENQQLSGVTIKLNPVADTISPSPPVNVRVSLGD
jgi:hypothetical protein